MCSSSQNTDKFGSCLDTPSKGTGCCYDVLMSTLTILEFCSKPCCASWNPEGSQPNLLATTTSRWLTEERKDIRSRAVKSMDSFSLPDTSVVSTSDPFPLSNQIAEEGKASQSNPIAEDTTEKNPELNMKKEPGAGRPRKVKIINRGKPCK